MKRLILMICLVFLLMILAVKADDIVEWVIDQYNTMMEEMQEDINDTFNSLMGGGLNGQYRLDR